MSKVIDCWKMIAVVDRVECDPKDQQARVYMTIGNSHQEIDSLAMFPAVPKPGDKFLVTHTLETLDDK